jgi:asparagine synthase (glutamine-hydrolysing)
VRDRFGVKPLYWTNTGDEIVFGSEIKVVFAHPQVPRQFSSQGLYHQLMQTMVPGTTCFEGIHAVEPGQMVVIERRNGAFQHSHPAVLGCQLSPAGRTGTTSVG